MILCVERVVCYNYGKRNNIMYDSTVIISMRDGLILSFDMIGMLWERGRAHLLMAQAKLLICKEGNQALYKDGKFYYLESTSVVLGSGNVLCYFHIIM